jgi:hypothetical protein
MSDNLTNQSGNPIKINFIPIVAKILFLYGTAHLGRDGRWLDKLKNVVYI